MTEDKKVFTEKELAEQFQARYAELCEEFGFTIDAIPFETETTVVQAKLRLAKVVKEKATE